LLIVNEFPGRAPWPREVKWVLIFSREEILFNVQCWESNSTARSMAISTYLLREIFFCRAIKAAFLCSSGFMRAGNFPLKGFPGSFPNSHFEFFLPRIYTDYHGLTYRRLSENRQGGKPPRSLVYL
jgi:hypothetical protein